ncbi:putative nitrate assimilation regulatory protein nirA [Metarhizium acridum CQMa 102]|uniref:Putative nitrate assimilation regulatory protein nirA n=1 Tax=Metarhizium acridum (strain CQMa 102) TaxID=655827 RepID=E9E058_METAQ|nr:putative nitrate assimilation regulatory protein nirA [Metarhizium acridum CQMa 102]EFY90659.1 putative nitrate assimilation regulatory protein nirA [Metarhizium acridum CQMa 102]
MARCPQPQHRHQRGANTRPNLRAWLVKGESPNGERPTCASCATKGDTCLYETDRSGETHLQAIKRKFDEMEATNTMYEKLHGLLQVANEADAKRVFEKIRRGVDIGSILVQVKETSTTTPPDTASEDSPSPCFQQLHSWKYCRPTLRNHRLSTDTDESTILTLPPRPLDAYVSHWHQDRWTQIGWTKAHIHHLIDAIFSWDYLPFSLLSHDLFLQSFYSDSSQFCSSALVCAILALACRLINEDKDELEVLPSGWIGSKTFFYQANAKLHKHRSKVLPDIQAIGILSLYHLRCGQEAKAQEYAENFIANIKEYHDLNSSVRNKGEQYERVLDITYCGAVSLSRMLLLTTGRVFTIQLSTAQTHVSILNTLHPIMQTRNGGRGSSPALTPGGRNLQMLGMQFISGKIFQLTEWVYNFIALARSNIRNGSGNVRAFYKKCLDWYKELFAYAESDCGRTPFVLFAHIYYHYCLLCAFRPLIGRDMGSTDIRPFMICKETAQSVLALAQSYDDLFTLRRVSGLMPYFVCTAGMLSLSMETEGRSMSSVHLRLQHSAQENEILPMGQSPSPDEGNVRTASPYITMSATDHARLLLTKMGSAHPAANIARNQLQVP